MTFRLLFLCAALALAGCSDDGGTATSGDETGSDSSTETGGGSAGGPPPALTFEELTFEPDTPVEITEFKFVPGTSDELLLLAKDGFLDHLRLEGDTLTRLARVEVPGNYTHWECGLLSLAFDPDFETNRYIYLGHCADITGSKVQRFTFTPDDYDAIPGTAATILEVYEESADKPWHNIGSIGFDHDGNLWALFGEKLRQWNAQDQSNKLGTLARVVPNREPDGEGSTPAPGNPLVDVEGMDPDIYAWGLRSPWRGLIDDRGRYWVGDVGLDDYEEINVIDGPGANLGWNVHEGPCPSDCDGFQDPVAGYTHSDGDPYVLDDLDAYPSARRAIFLGGLFTGTPDDPYGGRYDGHTLFSDFCVGFVRALSIGEDGQVETDLHVGHLLHITSAQVGPDGFIYVSTYGKCDATSGPESPGRLLRAVPVN